MHHLDEQIQRAYFALEEYQRQRLWLERLIHPEKFKWMKRGAPPAISDAKKRRIDELAKIGLGEARYQELIRLEALAKAELEDLARSHVLWPHFERIKGFGPYLCGAFIAAAGDISRVSTIAQFWSGMGLGMNPDGTVPRRRRTGPKEERTSPCLPFVSRIGDQIRQQINRTPGTKLRAFYEKYREHFDSKYPDRPKMFNFKAALRDTQKLFYAVLLMAWKEAYGQPLAMPYPFAILRHDLGHMLTIKDFYDHD